MARKKDEPIKKKNPGGRPTKYNDEIAALICKHLERGSTRTDAYGAAGIGQQTFLDWLRKFPGFSDKVTVSESKCATMMADAIVSASRSDWRAAETWLKRRRKDEWSEKIEQQHSGSIETVTMTPEEYREKAKNDPAGAVRDYRTKIKQR